MRPSLTPGQSTRESYMPLDDFIAETMESFRIEETPDEVIIQRAKMLRAAEANGQHAEVFQMLNDNYEG